jgi:peptidoglycan DL-endopeptidase CwlO
MAVRLGGRQRRLTLFVIFATIVAVFGAFAPAYADPSTDGEGGTQTLREKLEEASQGYYSAKQLLTASQKRQAEITVKLRESELSLTRMSTEVGNIAAARYKGSQLGVLNGLITGDGTPSTLLQGAAVADYLVWRDDEQLRQYRQARDDSEHQKKLLEVELGVQAKALTDLDTQKRAAEKALASVGGMVTAGYSGPVPEAQPAPRNADGSWPRESRSIQDPTEPAGRITPRMYHALIEAQLAGFTRYTHCWRMQSFGEHPKGRACDFSASKGGFGGAATGADKAYGTRLAAWCMANAEALGVLYVIWYRQIWMPGVGWRAYFGSGDPSAEHTNHVHLSVL